MSNYDERVNDEADQHAQMMQEQREKSKGGVQFEWHKATIKYNTYKSSSEYEKYDQ